MSVREILRMGDPRLRRIAEPVRDVLSDELRSLLVDMRDTMVAANGAGLAAPQIGVNLQVVIFGTGQVSPRYPQEPPSPPTVLINPIIEPLDAQETLGWEGCLSVPGLRGQVP
ncbi:MAG: peptide deformylase, partial [Betaproteobacteria bacterium]